MMTDREKQETHKVRETQETQEVRETQEVQETKEARETKEVQETKEVRETKEAQEAHKVRETKDDPCGSGDSSEETVENETDVVDESAVAKAVTDDVENENEVVEDLNTGLENENEVVEDLNTGLENEDAALEELSVEDRLRLELTHATEAKLRALADFKNFQRRSLDNEARAVGAGMARVIRSIIPAIEQMNMAIEHAGDDAIVQGFEMARDEFLRGLAECGVLPIEPEVGDAFDPQLHEAMMRQDSEDVETDHIMMVMQKGFQLGDIVISPAKVSLST